VIPRTPGRLVALAVLLALVSALVGACSSTMRDAATITYEDGDGNEQVVHIRRDDFEDDIRELQQSSTIREGLAQIGVEPQPDGTADADLSAWWLTNEILNVAVDDEFADRGLELTDAQREEVATGIDLGDLDEALKDKIVDSQAKQQALLAALAEDVEQPRQPTEAELRAIYEQNAAALTACASGKEVSHILVADEATANEIAGELAAGGSFADIATTRSTDTGSGAQGGSLGCLGAQPFVEAFQQAADAAPLDQVVGPVQTEFGYHLILVTTWNPSFEKVRGQLEQQYASQAQQQAQQLQQQAFGDAILPRLDAMKVHVDPRYGKWETEEGEYAVVAPAVPEPRNQREPATTTTTPAIPGLTGG
jgi:hypothetical protein